MEMVQQMMQSPEAVPVMAGFACVSTATATPGQDGCSSFEALMQGRLVPAPVGAATAETAETVATAATAGSWCGDGNGQVYGKGAAAGQPPVEQSFTEPDGAALPPAASEGNPLVLLTEAAALSPEIRTMPSEGAEPVTERGVDGDPGTADVLTCAALPPPFMLLAAGVAPLVGNAAPPSAATVGSEDPDESQKTTAQAIPPAPVAGGFREVRSASLGKTAGERTWPGVQVAANTAALREAADGGNIPIACEPRQGPELKSTRNIGIPAETTVATSLPKAVIAGAGHCPLSAGVSPEARVTDGAPPSLPSAIPAGVVPQKNTTSGGEQTGRTPTEVGQPLMPGRGAAPVQPEETMAPKAAGASAEKPANIPAVERSVEPSARGGLREQDKNGATGKKEKGEGTSACFGGTQLATADPAQSSRFTLQTKGDDMRSALHESIMSQVRESEVSFDGKGNGRITVRLNPQELGELQVSVRVENQRVKVEIITDNRTVRDALMGNLDALKETLQKQNLNMDGFDVSSRPGNGFSQGFREERGAQRSVSSILVGHEAGMRNKQRERGDDWEPVENSLVNLLL